MANTLNAKDPGPVWQIMIDLLDDLDTLEAKCEWQIGIIERMKPWLVGHEEFPEFDKLKADLERGPVG